MDAAKLSFRDLQITATNLRDRSDQFTIDIASAKVAQMMGLFEGSFAKMVQNLQIVGNKMALLNPLYQN